MVVAALCRLGRYTRFVSHSVMIGFLTGVSVNIVCGQLGDLTGTSPQAPVNIGKVWWLLTDLGAIEVAPWPSGWPRRRSSSCWPEPRCPPTPP